MREALPCPKPDLQGGQGRSLLQSAVSVPARHYLFPNPPTDARLLLGILRRFSTR